MRTTIREYRGGRDQDVAALVLSIQNGEAALGLSIEDQPDLLDIAREYRGGGFWVAEDDRDTIVGCIGLLVYGGTGVLKKFFVEGTHRGHGGPAYGLFDALLARAGELSLTDIVLDTPAVASRSHVFYEKNGFRPARVSDLPTGYHFPYSDSILYRRRIAPAC